MNKVCYNCKYENLKVTEEPCKYCTGDGGSHNKWEEKHCIDCTFFLKGYDEEPCEFCCGNVNKPNFKLQEREETEANSSEQEIKSCLDCKHFSKDIDEEPCCDCLCVGRGDHSYWEVVTAPTTTTTNDTEETEEIFCEDCKYADLGTDEEPCNRCKQNSGNIAEDHDKLTLCYEPKETESEQKDNESSIDDDKTCTNCKHFAKTFNVEPCHSCRGYCTSDVTPTKWEAVETKGVDDILPSCHTCKYATEPTHNRPCANCIALGNGIQSYWEARNDEPQTAREIVEKTVEQHLQEEHYDEHYHDKVQPLEIMQEIMTPEEFKGFLFGNIIKYTCRCGRKDEPQKEFSKLRRYREWYDMAVMGRHIDPRI